MWPFKPNDWKPVFVAEPDDFTVTTTYAGFDVKGTEHAEKITHTLYYSKSRNKYRIDWSGHFLYDACRTTIPSYIACVKKQIELESKTDN
jgi:hypothetical protein